MSPALVCCKPDCAAPAEWEVWDRIEPYSEHYLHACSEHLGWMLSDAPVHEVYPVEKTP